MVFLSAVQAVWSASVPPFVRKFARASRKQRRIMRNDALKANSFAFTEITIIFGGVYFLALIAFTKFWGLLVADQLLAPLAIVMGIEFASSCLLAQRLGQLTWARVVAALSVKTMLVLAVAFGFAIQRAAMIIEENPWPWGDAVIGSVIIYEAYRFIKTLAAFDIRLWAVTEAAAWVSKVFTPPADEYQNRRKINRAVVVERRAAVEEYYDTGKPGSQPSLDILSGDDLPSSDLGNEPPGGKRDEGDT